MKLLRYGPVGQEKPGLLDAAGQIRDLSGHVADIGPAQLSAEGLAALAALDIASLPVVSGSPRLGVPYTGTPKFLAVGLNYADHAAESNLPLPKEPVLFTKAISCLNGPNDDVMLPQDSVKSDWEVELGIVIGKTARYVDEADALSHVAGYVLVNDVSEREYQIERGGTWDKGKGCDTFGPVGPWLVTADEIADPQNIDLWLDVNGARRQTGNTGTMIFGVATLVSYISRFVTLQPGDLITTGTPPGVGMGVKPEPVFLKAGDVMRLGSDLLGTQQQTVIAWRR
ncbi:MULTISPECIES: fumarylacetoacetate hydrolase family protein [Nitrospirillum]|uniref:2-hydroxyhepta-2,4-diene-1,7-dioate isomerase n=2 Tax=Nitrospirillum TaxID=1543705 RepID=A0A248JN60_9PROT|nr:fumarylacetoacetate hydrolase family protein [Nitrospirillum amazonense]ASG20172.1 2-hydroxyhepta-2,4-diene-1,7-dioate isomerase [Nitrospirillum amazonense CBAmc]TWB29550.1 2-keto-4-pentenoate hydratase/2-oxohepta-3-ene-1,7-dioic acid hydratase in catechol pathway [Nitrospirillum amazonense]TWB30470.1 2-keto-4-pentenoate hydratase/2-oxohepta-3-ene-1,7-dioic acid hydratase in catechol pathway [Nitrospirillum amazonense]